jgi:hypothetical protein
MNQEIKKIIAEIPVNKANLQHIASTGVINGSLLIDIEQAMVKYAEHQKIKFSVAAQQVATDECRADVNKAIMTLNIQDQ